MIVKCNDCIFVRSQECKDMDPYVERVCKKFKDIIDYYKQQQKCSQCKRKGFDSCRLTYKFCD